MCKLPYKNTHICILSNTDRLYVITSLKAARQSKAKLFQIINFCLFFLLVCFQKGNTKAFISLQIPSILFPLVLSSHISYQPPPSNSLYLPYCRSLIFVHFALSSLSFVSLVLMLFLSSLFSFSVCLSLSPPHPILSSVCFCNHSVFPIVAVILQI